MNIALPILAFSEPGATALWLSLIGALVGICVLLSRFSDRIGVPVVLVFLVLGMLGGSEGFGGLAFDNYGLAVRLGTMALVLILFDGGLNTSIASVRRVLTPSLLLATLGVVLTAVLVAGFGRLIGLSWPEAMLLGAVVSSTDTAAVFAVLRGGRVALRPKVGRTLEVESCVNDPMAVIMTVALVEIFSQTAGSSPDAAVGDAVPGLWATLAMVPVQLVVGVLVGVAVGLAGGALLRRVRLSTGGLYPALTLSLAFLSFGFATLVYGSGFMSVFATGLVLGNGRRLPYSSGLSRVHDAMAWLSQIGMFLMLGLLVFPSRLLPVVWEGVTLALFLGLVARPVAVAACAAWFGYTLRELAYIAMVGLRGAVPIILATFPVLAGVDGAERVFNLVFFIVVFSSLFPGMLIRPLARWLEVAEDARPTPAAVLEINAAQRLDGDLVAFHIDPSLAVCGAELREIAFPPGASVALIVRGGSLVAAKGSTRLQCGDYVYVFFKDADRPLVELLFGAPAASA
ncbi:MAG: potassium/proton antiporter [Tepidisphaerales bacterium]